MDTKGAGEEDGAPGDYRDVAAGQFGALTREQMGDAGLSPKQIRARTTRGDLEKHSHRVFTVAGSVDSFERRATCALLDSPAGSGLSFTSAIGWYGAPGWETEPIHVSQPRLDRSRATRVRAIRHHPVFLPSNHVICVNGLAVTTPSRTAADLGHVRGVHPERIARAIEWMWARGLTDRQRLERMADEWCERGRRGSAFLHAFLDERPAEWRPPESGLERRFNAILVRAGFPKPIKQVDVGSDEAWFGRTDFLDPELPLMAEIDSDAFHSAPLDVASDERRDEAADRAGFVVERFAEAEVWYQPDEVVRRWRLARNALRRAS